jgi:hypothetical protein
MRIFWFALAVWAATMILSVVYPMSISPTGDGFTRGLNRVTAFFSWQIGGAIIALSIWMQGRSLTNRALRWLSRIPVLWSLILTSLVIGTIIWAKMNA